MPMASRCLCGPQDAPHKLGWEVRLRSAGPAREPRHGLWRPLPGRGPKSTVWTQKGQRRARGGPEAGVGQEAGPGGVAGRAAANGLNETRRGGAGRGPGGGGVSGRRLAPQSEAGCPRQRKPAEAERGAHRLPGRPRAGAETRDWMRRAAAGPHRPAAAMCDCFHMVLPTWPGAPGSGAPPLRLQPAALGRVGSARGRAPGCAVRVGVGRLGDRPGVSRAFLSLGAARDCLPPAASRLLPGSASLRFCRSLCLSGSLTHLYHSLCRSPPLSLTIPACLYLCSSPLGCCLVPRGGRLGRAARVVGA